VGGKRGRSKLVTMTNTKNMHIWQRNQLAKVIATKPMVKLIGRMDHKAASETNR
jgi:hypothetical protein